MKIVIAGGSGFLGRPLAPPSSPPATTSSSSPAARRRPFARRPRAPPGRPTAGWAPGRASSTAPTPSSTSPASRSPRAAGAAAHKRADSRQPRPRHPQPRRTPSGRRGAPPAVFVSGSAVGYYGPRGDEVVTEEHRRAHDFLAASASTGKQKRQRRRRDARAWSASARGWCWRAMAARCRRCCRRSGSAPAGRSVRAGNTGRGSTGRTGSIWSASPFETPAVAGPLNATAPAPVTNAEFARRSAGRCGGPAFMPRAGLRAEAAARRDGRGRCCSRANAPCRPRRSARLHVHLPPPRRCAAGNFQPLIVSWCP